MGNRAIIIDAESYRSKQLTVGIYIHCYVEKDLRNWLQICKDRGYRTMKEDPPYGAARLCQVACEDTYESGLNVGLVIVDTKEDTPQSMWLDVGFVLVDGYDIAEVIE